MLNCAEFDLLFSEVLTRDDLPAPALQHLAECRHCAGMLEDFEAIAESVRQLPSDSPDPVPDLWPQIRETLRREGVIHSDGRDCGTPLRVVHRASRS